MSTEEREFKMHNNLMQTIIYNQAGSLEKSILELIMNSIDANANSIKLDVDEKNNIVTVIDDGKGFSSENEIEMFFDTLGTPHEENDAVFGRFRIGRTQIFSYGKCIWRSGTFKMEVDLRNNGGKLGYKLTKDLEVQKGCIIEIQIYDEVIEDLKNAFYYSLSTLVKKAIMQKFTYSDIPIYFNDESIVNLNSEVQWDLETDDAYFLFNDYRGACIYNQGAFVVQYEPSYFGTGVDVVSKKQLEVNFARNDIVMHRCEVWQRISREIHIYVQKNKLGNKKLNEDEKKYFFNMFINKELPYHKIREVKFFTDIFKKDFSIKEFVKAERVAYSDENNEGKLAEMVHESKHALVFHKNFSNLIEDNDFYSFIETVWMNLDSIHEDFIFSEEDNKGLSYKCIKEDISLVSTQELINDINVFKDLHSDEHEIIDSKDLNILEYCALKSIRRLNDIFYKEYSQYFYLNKKRKIVFGKSLASEAWTDGFNYIAINIKYAESLNYGIKSFEYVLLLIIHEYCHDCFTVNQHPHDEEFYKKFHDIVLNGNIKEFKPELIAIQEFPKRAALSYYRSLYERQSVVKINKKLKDEFIYEENRLNTPEINFFFFSLDKRITNSFKESMQKSMCAHWIYESFLKAYYYIKSDLQKQIMNDIEKAKLIYRNIDSFDEFIDFSLYKIANESKRSNYKDIVKNLQKFISNYKNAEDKSSYSIHEYIKEEFRLDEGFRGVKNELLKIKHGIHNVHNENILFFLIKDQYFDKLKEYNLDKEWFNEINFSDEEQELMEKLNKFSVDLKNSKYNHHCENKEFNDRYWEINKSFFEIRKIYIVRYSELDKINEKMELLEDLISYGFASIIRYESSLVIDL